MKVVGGIDLDRVYTADEVFWMYRQGILKKITLNGYLARADWDGTVRFVHYLDPTANRMTPGSTGGDRLRVAVPNFDVVAELQKGLPEIKKRTPQERVASLAEKIKPDAKVLGGDPESIEDARRLAAHALAFTEAEEEVKGAERRLLANRKDRRRQAELERLERKGRK